MIGSGCLFTCASVCGLLSLVLLAMMIFGIVEKRRWTPFYQEMKCVASAPFALRMSKMSAPSPLAESMGLAPGPPPFGVYFDMTTTLTCKNPNQVSVTMQAEGSSTEMFAPNLTDLAFGGTGLPYTKVAHGHLTSEAHIAAGGGTGEARQISKVEFPLADVLAIAGTAAVQGYAPLYVKSIMPMESCMKLFGQPMCQETVEEQWCGSFGGNCLAKVLGVDGLPVEPVLLEPAMCTMTKAICGTEADMKAELTPEAVGLEVIDTIPCPPTSGLPNTMRCNVITAPGIDAATLEPKLIDPPMQLTARAQQKMDEKLAEGEALINMLTTGVIICGALFGTLCAVVCLMCFCRACRAKEP